MEERDIDNYEDDDDGDGDGDGDDDVLWFKKLLPNAVLTEK